MSDSTARTLALAAIGGNADVETKLEGEIRALDTKVDQAIAAGFKPMIVEELPTEDISNKILYLVLNTGDERGNVYNEYLYIDNQWEMMGTTAVDLSDYVTKSQAETISGVKTFSALPESSVAPTTDNQLANKKYIDDGLGTKQDTLNANNKLDPDFINTGDTKNKFFSGFVKDN